MVCVECSSPLGYGENCDSRIQELLFCSGCGRAHFDTGQPVYGKDCRPLFAVEGGWGTEPDTVDGGKKERSILQTSPYS